MSKRLLLLAALALSPGYSFSDPTTPYYGQTPNAAANGLRWSMDSVFPEPPGLDVQNIIYNYTIQKEVQDQVNVTLQNENALGDGYIFRNTDEWRPGSLGGTELNKVIPIIPNIPKAAWGDGEIVVDGPGSVEDPNVIYTYRVDPCFDPQFDPSCPGWQAPKIETPEIELYDPLANGDAEIAQYEDKANYKDDEKQAEEEEELSEEEQNAVEAAANADMFAQAFVQAQQLAALNAAANMTSYYSVSIPGGVYKESVQLNDKKLPENRRGLRNGLAQQILHEKMIDMQYNR